MGWAPPLTQEMGPRAPRRGADRPRSRPPPGRGAVPAVGGTAGPAGRRLRHGQRDVPAGRGTVRTAATPPPVGGAGGAGAALAAVAGPAVAAADPAPLARGVPGEGYPFP